jgi:putative component of membrane protein insertase Oxa1/YidC/SpoIIIJ protein YidD
LNRPPGLLASLALYAIRGYQRYLPPRKGFSCAYRCATGRDGCSGYGYRVIGRFGVGTGLALLRRRLRLCGETYRRRSVVPNPVLYYQRGECDPGCDPGCDTGCLPDLPCSGDGVAEAGDCVCNCGGDLFGEYLSEKYRRIKERWQRWRLM